MLNIPDRLKFLLENNQSFFAFVHTNISNMSEWIKDNKTVFFPEYTDHSFTHLNEVIKTVDSLITDESWEHLTPQDAAAIVTSVLLHDCAMHLSEDGFYTLINGKYSGIESRYIIQEKTWAELWTDFMAEAKRFDAKKLNSIFGDDRPIHNIPENKIDLSSRDKLLIGEFVRRHHARLAHEIAFNGIPGVSGASVRLGSEPERGFLDLCGFIARSHNMTLRNAVDSLEHNKKRVHLNTHVPYVMLLLRVADYIQIQSTRAPKKLLEIKTLLSPISKGEWKKHSAIVEVNQAHDDPEAIYVDAEPENAIVLESLVDLFRGFQSELDISWSVLGEIYGRYQPFDNLGITIRRIRSSLDNLNRYVQEKKPNFIPKVLKFQTSDTEMIELLIKPLYGDSPYAGIRELLQNSVDACIELDDLIKKRQLSIERKVVDVSVTVIDGDDEFRRVEIEDYGIGMTLEIVQKYFLNIGASFRNSDWWRENYQTKGRADIHRTGRFGVGLLAAFLLGDELQVQTRYYNHSEDEALSFQCKKGDQTITVTSSNMAHIGTKITIKINKNVFDKLALFRSKWDWFTLDYPQVKRKLIQDGKEIEFEQKINVPRLNPSDNNWFEADAEGFDHVLWTYDQFKRDKDYPTSILVCNGIFIKEEFGRYGSEINFPISTKLGVLAAHVPTLVVFDQDGKLPLNLSRDNLLSNELPFHDALTQSLANNFAQEMYSFFNQIGATPKIEKDTISAVSQFSHIGLGDNYYYSIRKLISKFAIGNKGLMPVDFWFFNHKKVEKLYLGDVGESANYGVWQSNEFSSNCESFIPIRFNTSSKGDRSRWVRVFFEMDVIYPAKDIHFDNLPIIGKRMLARKKELSLVSGNGYVPVTFIRALDKEWEDDEWVLFKIGDVPALEFDIQKVVSQTADKRTFGFIGYYLNWNGIEENEHSPFSRAWQNCTN